MGSARVGSNPAADATFCRGAPLVEWSNTLRSGRSLFGGVGPPSPYVFPVPHHHETGLQNVTSDGIEPPLSDLESEVLPLHHEALLRPGRGL